ncbi:hypothetical protein, partial [Rhizobium fabae]|uniref:hypothetical protein n=1 Tax=Rhizobium fabae TaxID=573179 RepID=UPI001ABF9526
ETRKANPDADAETSIKGATPWRASRNPELPHDLDATLSTVSALCGLLSLPLTSCYGPAKTRGRTP